MSSDIAISVTSLSKCYEIYANPSDRLKQFIMPRVRRILGKSQRQYFQEFWALNDVTFEVKKGETVGIVGSNGSGKSTLLQMICGTLNPTSGSIQTNGRIAALLELGSGFNPEFTGRENVFLNATVLGLSKEEIDARFDDIAAFADIGQFIEQPVKTYSSGMVVRLAFAVAINVDPEILVVDEALSVGDELFQRKCFSRIEAIKDGGATILFVSHSGGTIVELCDRAILMDAGEKLAIGIPKKIVGCYQKMLYAKGDMREVFREQIRRADMSLAAPSITLGHASHKEPSSNKQEQEPQDIFDPNLKSNSIIDYESNGAHIDPPVIQSIDSRQVNHLLHGESYRFLYTVKFSAPAKRVSFSMLIKAVNGVELSGVAFPVHNEEVLIIEDPCKIFVEFLFTCKLLPGMYYVNVGCRGIIDGEEEFLHRIVDAICFRVLPRENLGIRAGYFDFIEPVGCELSLDI
jgi:lipopolysaccharide transport system ATP-binding protein